LILLHELPQSAISVDMAEHRFASDVGFKFQVQSSRLPAGANLKLETKASAHSNECRNLGDDAVRQRAIAINV